jgi:hypothetical protein
MPWDYALGVFFYETVGWGVLGFAASRLWKVNPTQ